MNLTPTSTSTPSNNTTVSSDAALTELQQRVNDLHLSLIPTSTPSNNVSEKAAFTELQQKITGLENDLKFALLQESEVVARYQQTQKLDKERIALLVEFSKNLQQQREAYATVLTHSQKQIEGLTQTNTELEKRLAESTQLTAQLQVDLQQQKKETEAAIVKLTQQLQQASEQYKASLGVIAQQSALIDELMKSFDTPQISNPSPQPPK